MIGRRKDLLVAPLVAPSVSSAAVILGVIVSMVLLSSATPVCRAERTPAQGPAQGPGGPEWFRDSGTVRPTDPFGAGSTGRYADPPATPAAPTPTAAPADAGADAGGAGTVVAGGTATAPATPAAPADAGERPRRPYALPPARVPGVFYPTGSGTNGNTTSYVGYGPYDFPAGQFNSYVAALARAATARALFRRAESELNMAVHDYERRFESSAELRQALTAERDAYNNLNAARRRALQSVVNDERYKRLGALRQDLADQIQAGRIGHALSPEQIMAMAQLKMQYSTDLHVMEADVLNADAAVRDAQDRLVAAGTRVAALRQQHDESRRADADLLAARRNVEDARVTMLTAQTYLQGTIGAADVALDAYYWARTPFRGYYPGGYTGGYGGY